MPSAPLASSRYACCTLLVVVSTVSSAHRTPFVYFAEITLASHSRLTHSLKNCDGDGSYGAANTLIGLIDGFNPTS